MPCLSCPSGSRQMPSSSMPRGRAQGDARAQVSRSSKKEMDVVVKHISMSQRMAALPALP